MSVKTFKDLDFRQFTMPIITVYDKPLDYPTKFVARLYDLQKATEFAVIADSLEEIRKTIPGWMVKMDRDMSDVKSIVEIYI